MTRTRRISQAVLGLMLAALGAVGIAATWTTGPALAQGDAADAHELMHEMMAATHGDEAVARMHAVEGADEMMDQCAGMMDAMGGMSDMMNGGGMSGMDGRGMSNMMRGMMGD